MNLGISHKLQEAFPSVVRVERPLVELPQTIDPEWLAGFTSAEGTFLIKIQKFKNRVGYTVHLVFQLTQHIRDKQLIKSFIALFNCGRI